MRGTAASVNSPKSATEDTKPNKCQEFIQIN